MEGLRIDKGIDMERETSEDSIEIRSGKRGEAEQVDKSQTREEEEVINSTLHSVRGQERDRRRDSSREEEKRNERRSKHMSKELEKGIERDKLEKCTVSVKERKRDEENSVGEEEVQGQAKGGRRKAWSNRTSYSSEIELIDRDQLERCIEENREKEERRSRVEEEGDEKGGRGVRHNTSRYREAANEQQGKNREREEKIEKKRRGRKGGPLDVRVKGGSLGQKQRRRKKKESEKNENKITKSSIRDMEGTWGREREEEGSRLDRRGKRREEGRGGVDKKKRGSNRDKTNKESTVREDEVANIQNISQRYHTARHKEREIEVKEKGIIRRVGEDKSPDSREMGRGDRQSLETCREGLREKEREEGNRVVEGIIETQGRGNRRRIGSDTTSESSETNLIDRYKLESCIVDIKEKGERSIRVEVEEIEQRADRTRDNTYRGEESRKGGRDREREGKRGKEKGMEKGKPLGRSPGVDRLRYEQWTEGESRMDRSNSEITTSSIAALFVDKHLEREGRKIGSKQITRRKVWEKWRGIVRGSIRRENKRKIKTERNAEKDKLDSQLVFDYTTQGLTVEEMKLLGRGEGFCVVDHSIDEDKTKVDIYQFQRRLRLHERFREGVREEEELELDGDAGRTVTQRKEDERGRGQNRSSTIEAVGQSSTAEETGRRRVNRTSTSARRSTVEENTQRDIGRETIVRNTGRGSREVNRDRQNRLSTVEAVVVRSTVGGAVESRVNRVKTPVNRGNRQRDVGGQNRKRDLGGVSSGRYRDPRQREERLDVDRITPRTTGRRGEGIRENRLNRMVRGTVGRVRGRESRVNRDSIPRVVVSSRGGERQERNGRRRTQRGGDREIGVGESRRSTIGRESIGIRENTDGTEREEERDREIDQREKGRRLPSMYDPESQNRSLNRYNTCIQEEILLTMGEKKTKFKDNISKEERGALKSLKRRIEEKEIIVTKADKGSGIVAIDYETYIKKGTKYIEEEVGAYNKVQESQQSIINRVIKERNKIAEQLKEKGVIMVQTATYIKKQLEEKITGIKFYYKIHKDKNIESMPLRPLQSCIKSPIQHLSIVLTDILQPLLTEKNIPTFIFDSNQLLFRLNKLGNIPDECTLVSSDVSALYPSIPHREGFRAMKLFLKEKTRYSEEQIEEIMTALRLVITENYMVWNKQIYKQISGVAMGTPVAVAYANIFMNWVDGEVKKGAPYIHEHIRFIDDNLFIVPIDRVTDMIEVANNILAPDIKFTYEKLDDKLGKGLLFLDTQLFIAEDRRIESRLYTKGTDRHAYLLPSSFHPAHITQNIPKAVFGRIRKLCSKDEWYREDAEKAEGWLLNRGYKKIEIQKAIEETSQKDRWSMIEQVEQNRDKKEKKKEEEIVDIPLIITYNQHGRKIKKILKDRQPLLEGAFRRTKVKPRLSYRRKRNLNDLLVQKGLRGPIEDRRKELNIFSRCEERPGYRSRCPCKGRHSQDLCRCCMHSRGEIEGVENRIYKPVNCNSKNIIYVIGCRICDKKYVGETQQRVKDRLAQHMYNVDKLNQPLYLHFRQVHKLEDLYIAIVETVRGEEPFMRKVREAWWINHLRT